MTHSMEPRQLTGELSSKSRSWKSLTITGRMAKMDASTTKTQPSDHALSSNQQEDENAVAAEFFGAVAPGALMILALQERGVTPREAAAEANIAYPTFFGILSGVEPVTGEYARQLPSAVGGDEHYWLRAEKGYQAELLRDGLPRPVYDSVEADRVADQVLGLAEDGLTEMELPVFSTLDD